MQKHVKQFISISLIGLCIVLGTIQGVLAKSSSVQLDDPLGHRAVGPKLQTFIGDVIGTGLGYVGTLALVMFIWGGIQWMTSAGNAGQVKKGKDTVVWAILGLVLIFTSYMILRFVLRILGVN